MTTAPATPTDADWQVICLCAAWCGTCRDWQAPFAALALAHPEVRLDWVDIEDEADTIGEVDVETFPTLLVSHQGQARFFGPVLPSGGQLARLLQSLRDDPRAGAAQPQEVTELLQRLQSVLLQKR